MFSGLARVLLTAALIVVPTSVTIPAPPAYADCGDPGQEPCTGPVPTVDQVVDIMNALFDPNVPALNKTNVVTPEFTPEEAETIDRHLQHLGSVGLLPLNWIITDIQPAPNNFAGATIESNHSSPGPVVFVYQGGHWMITHDSAWTALDNVWWNVTHYRGGGFFVK